MATLKDCIARDTAGLFFRSAEEFADEHTIGLSSGGAYTVLCSLQANTVSNTAFSEESPLQAFSRVLYVPYPIGGELTLEEGELVYVDDAPYRVESIEDVMGVATIMLSKGADKRRVRW